MNEDEASVNDGINDSNNTLQNSIVNMLQVWLTCQRVSVSQHVTDVQLEFDDIFCSIFSIVHIN